MGELCLRQAMRLPAEVPLTASGKQLRRADADRLTTHWTRVGVTQMTASFLGLAEELLALDDAQHLSPVSVSFLATRTRQAQPAVRQTLRRFVQAGRKLSQASDSDRLLMLLPEADL